MKEQWNDKNKLMIQRIRDRINEWNYVLINDNE